MNRWFLILVFLGSWFITEAQIGNEQVQFGINAQVGSQIKRIGLFLSYNYVEKSLQAHSTINLNYSHQGWGPQNRGLEFRLFNGLMYMYGTDVSEWEHLPSKHNYFIATQKQHALGLQHQYYLDNSKTSQATGTILLKFNQVLIQTENDLWGSFNGSDKYRTGALSIHYDYEDYSYGIKMLMWTGETRCGETKRVRDDQGYPAKYGYKDISGCPQSNYSHGVFAIEFKHQVNPYYLYQVSLGRDSERIRNLVQNRIIHDLPLVPASINKAQNLHIPMLDINGNPYLYREDQKIENGSWFYQLGFFDKNLY